jgi:hypothetical protein
LKSLLESEAHLGKNVLMRLHLDKILDDNDDVLKGGRRMDAKTRNRPIFSGPDFFIFDGN